MSPPENNSINFQWTSMAWSYLANTATDQVIYKSSGVSDRSFSPNDWETQSGINVLRFKYEPGGNMAEQRFEFDPQPEFWMRYWLRVPTNFYHGSANNKFLSIFGSTYDGAGTTTWETRPLSGGNSYIYLKDGGAVGYDEQETPFIDRSTDLGRWMQVVVHLKTASSSNASDGVIQLYRRWEDENSFTLLHDKQNATRQWESGTLGYRSGYFLGWANDPYSELTEWLLDDLEISSSSLITDAPAARSKAKAPGAFSSAL